LKIPLVKSAFSHEQETKQALADFIVDAPILSMGEKCFEFERQFADKQGRKECVLYNSGSSANLALLQALRNLHEIEWNDWLHGDKLNMGYSACTFATNVMPIIQCGMNPIPVDVTPNTLNTMSDNLAHTVFDTDHAGLEYLFITNLLGFSGDLPAIVELCKEEQIHLIEDNCESIGTELPTGKTGNFGEASTFSFFVAHQMSTIEGGAVCTDNLELAEMLRLVRAHGWDRNLPSADQMHLRARNNISDFMAHYTFYYSAYNIRPTEITGFLGIEQLKYLDENVSRREENYHLVRDVYDENPDFITIDDAHLSKISAFAIPIICNTTELRDAYVKKFTDLGVDTRPLIGGNMQNQPFYRRNVPMQYHTPGADFLEKCAFYVGNSPDYTTDELLVITQGMMK